MDSIFIEFRLFSWWRVATGEADSGRVDTLCARDQDKLPYIPAKQVRGLFREAARDASELEWLGADVAETLFGSRAESSDVDPSPDSNPGCLRFEDAIIAEPMRNRIIERDTSMLFDQRNSTAIQDGVAKAKSLRNDEVAVPVSLIGEISQLEGAPADWKDHLDQVMPLIRAIGQKRTRGFGRCAVLNAGAGAEA